jgi:hypothetical protein
MQLCLPMVALLTLLRFSQLLVDYLTCGCLLNLVVLCVDAVLISLDSDSPPVLVLLVPGEKAK